MNNSILQLLENITSITEKASIEVNKIYSRDFESYTKKDKSPLTEADIAAHHIICDALKKTSPYPILSEEGCNTSWSERKKWTRYWLVDPIDGTKEFIKKSGEFTINVGLIENGTPILGVVSAPALGSTYIGAAGEGAWKIHHNGVKQRIQVKKPDINHWKIVGSRSHGNKEVTLFTNALPNAELVSMGSSLKICAIAEGVADIYPRFGPTSEWDTAAAQAIIEAAGGQILTQNLTPLRYNTKDSVLNSPFIACKEMHSLWVSLWSQAEK